MHVSVIVGNPKQGSRTLQVAERVAEAFSDAVGLVSDTTIIDLSLDVNALIDGPGELVASWVSEIRCADVIIAVSPTYKGSYTGLLKMFFDLLPHRVLEGSVGVPVMVGASTNYALAPDVFLRPLLLELGASVPVPSLFVTEGEFGRLEEIMSDWASKAAPLIRAVVSQGLTGV